MSECRKLFRKMLSELENTKITNWKDISAFLHHAKKNTSYPSPPDKNAFFQQISNGAAFVTYDFGIDGVSIEIEKYALCLEDIFNQNIPLHFVAGDFCDKADVVLKPSWKRFLIDGINGWSKWQGGKWFSKLYYEEMPAGSRKSDDIAVEMWKQANDFAEKLGAYFAENSIRLMIPVNIPTNPGNFAVMLAIIIVSEYMGLYVISSNHDYYWEGGTPATEKKPGEAPGVRDHFFKNIQNRPFFELFTEMYPWNGKKWVQVNINTPQTETLVNKFGFDHSKVFELGTSISDKFFEPFGPEEVKSARRRMAYILSNGKPVITSISVKKHIAGLSEWMKDQTPVLCGSEDGIELDPATEDIIYCLQPTRVIARKRIEKDLQLLKALMKYPDFGDEFMKNSSSRLILHITGPVPIEHQTDLEKILNEYVSLCEHIPNSAAKRVFLAFSVGNEDHPALKKNNLESLCIEGIYRLADVILFPSETEGRGLPIVESGACGVPIICSRYYPEEVFDEVAGTHQPEEKQIKYLLFPKKEFSGEFLSEATDIMLHPEKIRDWKDHNRKAVMLRYSSKMIKQKFLEFFDCLQKA